MTQYLGLADLLLIAEAVLEVPAEQVFYLCDTGLAESALRAPAAGYGDYEQYPSMAQKAAVLGARLCQNHCLLDGNKRLAYLSMREFVARNGYDWIAPAADELDGDETVKVMWDLAAHQMSEAELTRWIADRIGESP